MQAQTGLFAAAVRWVARIGSIASGALLLAFVFGEGVNPATLTIEEWLGLAFFPGGIILGMIVGWRREGWGGAITLLSLLGFYALQYALTSEMPRGPYFFAFALPGLLFGISWWLHGEPFDHPPQSHGYV
jgi:hypothetical protein